MTRNLKALGLTLVVALTMGAVAAPFASAEEFAVFSPHWGGEPTSLAGVQGGEKTVLTSTAGTVECTGSTYTGTLSGFEATEVEVTPSYSNCTAPPIGMAEFKVNGCKYKLKAGAIEGGALKGTVDIVCPVGKEIEVVAKVAGVTKCTVKIPAQTGLNGATFSNVEKAAESEVTASITVEEQIQYTHQAGTGAGACSSGSASTGSYTGAAVVKGEVGGEAAPILAIATAAVQHGFISPSPVEIVGANGLKGGFLWFTQAGEYVISEQLLKFEEKYKLVNNVKADGPECGTTIKVPPARGCYFAVEGKGAGLKDTDNLLTKWVKVEAGAKPEPRNDTVKRGS